MEGLEPLQNPPGPQEGRLRDPSLQALLRELGAFNTGLCVITTRLAVADIADHDRASALRRELAKTYGLATRSAVVVSRMFSSDHCHRCAP